MLPEQKEFFECLYRDNLDLVYRRALKILKDEHLARDLTQDTFHEAIEQIDTVMKHENPVGWLLVVVVNKIKEYRRECVRDIKRIARYEVEFGDELVTMPQEIYDPNEKSVMDKVEAALTPEELHHLRRLVFQKASHKQVAKELGITVWASQKRLERIRDKLYEVFPERRRKKEKIIVRT